jgi:hypothetical protein
MGRPIPYTFLDMASTARVYVSMSRPLTYLLFSTELSTLQRHARPDYTKHADCS